MESTPSGQRPPWPSHPDASTQGEPGPSRPTLQEDAERVCRRARRLGLIDDTSLQTLLTYYATPGHHLPPAESLQHMGVSQLGFALVMGDANLLRDRQVAPHLTLLEKLGQGGMGTVYRAHDNRLSRIVAVKVLRDRDHSERALRRFEREARVMAQLDHPYCVRVFETGISPRGEPFFSMQLVVGHPLDRLIADAPKGIPIDLAQRYFREAAAALDACHALGIVHRDVKPSNLLIDASGKALLTDFGIAFTSETQRLTQAGSMIGTLAYMPPEQLRADEDTPPDPRSDLYSLGATLYHALVGEMVFTANHPATLVAKVTTEEPQPLRDARPEVPPSLEAVVLRCLAKSPDDRYPAASALLDALDGIEPPEADARRLNPATHLLAGAAGLLLGLLLLAFPLWRAQQQLAASPAIQPATATTPAPTPEPDDRKPGPVGRLLPGIDWISGTEYRNRKDGSILIYVPPGEFTMGNVQLTRLIEEVRQGLKPASELPPKGYDQWREVPAHRVRLTKGYLIGKYEVTWDQFKRFCVATNRSAPASRISRTHFDHRIDPAAKGAAGWPRTDLRFRATLPFTPSDTHPVYGISAKQAVAYAHWAGLDLPTEAQWEFAARKDHTYPWPWGPNPTPHHANQRDYFLSPADYQQVDGALLTSPVGSYPRGASPVGCLDMAGNVGEVTRDSLGAYTAELAIDPIGTNAEFVALRGGSYWESEQGRVSTRSFQPVHEEGPIGFRLSLDLD